MNVRCIVFTPSGWRWKHRTMLPQRWNGIWLCAHRGRKPAPKPGGILSPDIVKAVREKKTAGDAPQRRNGLEPARIEDRLFPCGTEHTFSLQHSKARYQMFALKVCFHWWNNTRRPQPFSRIFALLREQRTETLVRYYSEARTLGFDHTEKLHLVRTNKDSRWTSFTERLAIKAARGQLVSLVWPIASSANTTAKNCAVREEIRRLITSTAEIGCVFTNADGTLNGSIPNAIRTKRKLPTVRTPTRVHVPHDAAETAGELVDALFHDALCARAGKTESGNTL